MKDVAREAGVSTMTVSRVVTKKGRVAPKTVAKVSRVIEELGYVPDLNAGGLSSRNSGFVAVLVPSIDNSNFAQQARGITDALTKNGLQILLGSTDFSIEREETVLGTMLRRRPDGVILTGGNHTEGSRRMLENAGIPVVETWDLPRQPIDHVVGFSNIAIAQAMVDHLHERGYRHIGFIGSSSASDTRGADRERGFSEALRKHALDDSRVIRLGAPPIPVEQGGEAIVEMLRRWPDTDAVMFVSDRTAFGAMQECLRRGWPVPERVAIAGFGNFDMARNCHPRITTTSIDCYEMGRFAAERIISAGTQLADGVSVEPEIIMIPYRILARQTT
ncbi:MAG: LacI family DNA-binding transcriptional regulator [Rhodospirillales bacterium]|nr:LacI family DNA-binding transcriptional regulator [Rhodospirillales bacterium]